MAEPARPLPQIVLTIQGLGQLLSGLVASGYRLTGPTVRDGAIVYDEIGGVADLPGGWTDEQAPGRYRLARRDDGALFGYVVGPQAWKQFLHPPAVKLFAATREGKSFTVSPPDREAPVRTAFVGVRACELAAIARQDKVLLGGAFSDATYRAHRDGIFILAVQCAEARGTCFCASMGTGPRAEAGFDLALTERVEGDVHELLVEIGSASGAEAIARVGSAERRDATRDDLDRAHAASRRAESQMGRHLDTAGLPELLAKSVESPRWEEIAKRCMSCANCTMVCPTCFCTTVEDTTDLTGDHAERWRRWDSCYTMDFSYIHGGSIRRTGASRYRQWLTHKLSSWWEQFGTSGCVGCGRCITWCPAAIDITQEVVAIRNDDGKVTP